jgi:hypothetical protein
MRDYIIRIVARVLVKYPAHGMDAETSYYLGDLARGRVW